MSALAGWTVRDLDAEATDVPVEADVCIVGTGPAGLTLARALARRGLRTVLLERGGRASSLPDAAAEVAFDRAEYRGAVAGRAFGIGGTSALWGGQLLPVLPADVLPRPHTGCPGWPLAHAEIASHFAAVETMLGVDALPFDAALARERRHPLADTRWDGFAPRFSKWIPFRRRNLSSPALDADLPQPAPRVWTGADVAGFEWHPEAGGARVGAVLARSASGRQLRLTAGTVVLAAGALESTRLCLLLAEQGAIAGPSKGSALGHYLHDHFSIRAARVDVRERGRFNALFAPFFVGSTMRSLRLELDPALAARLGLPALYVHFVAVPREDSGFAAVRDTLRAAQRRDAAAALRHGTRALLRSPEVAAMALWRYGRGRLAFPAGADIHLHVDFEQPPDHANRIRLAAPGEPPARRLRIDWQLQVDPAAIAAPVLEALAVTWRANGLDRVASLVPHGRAAGTGPSIENLYDIFHPAGSTRMGATPQDGAVSPDLRLFGTGNVHVLSSSVFPSMGSANPTFTLLALAMRLAEHLADAHR